MMGQACNCKKAKQTASVDLRVFGGSKNETQHGFDNTAMLTYHGLCMSQGTTIEKRGYIRKVEEPEKYQRCITQSYV